MGQKMRELVEELHRLRAEIKQMGGPEKVKKQHERGKLTVRERIELLFDSLDTFFEIGILGTEPGPERTPADGVVTGFGKIDGRWVGCIAYDYTVKGGSMGFVNELKCTRIRELCLRWKIPLVWLIDSGGARISAQSAAGIGGGIAGEAIAFFANSGWLFKEESLMSGVIPLVCAQMGPGYAGTAYIPGLADVVFMVKGTSFMGLGGPSLVKMVTGETIDEENLGGSKIHTEISGCADNEYPDDQSCLKAIREYLSYMPSSNEEKPPRKKFDGDPLALIDDKILDVLPDNPKQAYDMHRIISFIVDNGEFFELKPKWARNIIVGFGRIGGYPVGIVANNPMFYGGVLDVNASDKAAKFIWLCDAFNIPLVFLADVPGFMVSSKTEKEGLIRHGAKMIHAVAEASVPKFTVIIRKAYGAGYYAMCGKSFDPDIIVAWPTGEISVMGPEGMVSIFAKKQLESMTPEEAKQFTQQMAEAIRPYIDIKKPAGWGFIDDVIDPRETRRVLYMALELTEKKKVLRERRKHGVYPV